MNNAIKEALVNAMTAQGWTNAKDFVETCSDDELADLVRTLLHAESK